MSGRAAVLRWVLALVVIGALGFSACARNRDAETAGTSALSANTVRSNLLRQDYVGSQACRTCHAEVARHWDESPMHRMTRDARRSAPRAPFDGRSLRFMGDTATLLMHEGRRYVEVQPQSGAKTLFAVTKLIGGRHREDFAGVEVSSTLAEASRSSDERILPVSYLIFEESLRYKGYSVMSPERPELRRGARWRTTCIFCHNTVAGISTLLDEVYGDGAPTYQGSASFELPAARRFGFHVTDEDALKRAIGDELTALGAPPASGSAKQLLDAAIEATRRKFRERDLVELGVGCEACHGGAREHASDPRRHPTFAVASDFLRVSAPGGTPPSTALDVNRTCARCHTVLFTRYPYTWEGGDRDREPGGSNINSGEARDFLLGGCASKLHCGACHDPHGEGSRARLGELEGRAGTELCTSCHESLRGTQAIARHTHHAPSGAGSSCIGCHMPRKNMGLAYSLTRYHRIGSPNDPERVERDRPIECALCHADQRVESLVGTMERWWKRRYRRSALHELYGRDLGVNVIEATLRRGKPHEKAVAIGVAREQRLASLAGLVVEELDNEYPLIRFFAGAALGEITGEKLPLDLHAPGGELVVAGRKWLEER